MYALLSELHSLNHRVSVSSPSIKHVLAYNTDGIKHPYRFGPGHHVASLVRKELYIIIPSLQTYMEDEQLCNHEMC